MKQSSVGLRACILIFLFITPALHAITIGSNSTVSIESFVEFPAIDYENAILGFAVMEQGFSLEDSYTTCTFASVFAVTGPITLNGGSLYLERDLHLDNITTLTSMGNIFGDGHAVELPSSMTLFGSTSQHNLFKLHDLQLVMNSNITLEAQICFEGESILDGTGNTLDLMNTGSIVVGENAHLTIRNVDLKGVSGDQIRCLDDTGVITLQNVVWHQTDDEVYTFSQGAFEFKDEVKLIGQGVFAYESTQTSTLLSNSSLFITNGMTFYYNPPTQNQNLFVLEESNSLIQMFAAKIQAGITGLQFTKGRVRILSESYFVSEKEIEYGEIISDVGITFGDGTSYNDAVLELVSGSELHLLSGSLNYRNVNTGSLVLGNMQSRIDMASSTRLRMYESINLDEGYLIFGDRAVIAQAPGATIIGATKPLGTVFYVGLAT